MLIDPKPLGEMHLTTIDTEVKTSYLPAGVVLPSHELSLEGINMAVAPFSAGGHVSLADHDNSLKVEWLFFDNPLPKSGISIRSKLPAGWNGCYHWNHITAFKDRKGPALSIASQCSRNSWVRTTIDPEQQSFTTTVLQIQPGPVHLAWISRTGPPFPVTSFKEVGANETGGIKFRVGNLEYILFKLEDAPLPQTPRKIPHAPGFAVLRYCDTELDGYWYFTETVQKAWK